MIRWWVQSRYCSPITSKMPGAVLTLSHVVALKGFVKRMQQRYAVYDPYVCGRLVSTVRIVNGAAITTTSRCPADASGPGGCYVCDYTGYSCGHCGDNVPKGKQFCSASCSGQYYAY